MVPGRENAPMRLKSLRVENFRSLQTLTIELPQACVIVGPNNSGKSNILEAIRRVLAPEWGPRTRDFTEDDVYLRDETLDIEIECAFEPPLEYRKLKEADPVEIERFRFVFDRYKIGPQAGTRRLEQSSLNAAGEKPTIMTSYGRKGAAPRFEPLIGIPQDLRDTVPLIHIGTDRSLRRQLPSAQYSLLRRIFEGINERLHDPDQTVKVRDRQGNEKDVPRIERFQQLITMAMNLLRTEEFNKLETSIKRNALEQLGLDADADAIDLYFTPLGTMDFYKSLDIIIKDHGFAISATESEKASRTPSCSLSSAHSRKRAAPVQSCLLKNQRCSCIHRCSGLSTKRCARSARPTRSSILRTHLISFPFLIIGTCSLSGATRKVHTSFGHPSQLTTSAARSF
jgi:putative ATP-dependent endonuclease of the OLD family